MTLGSVLRRLELALAAAYRRGVTTPKGLRIVLRAELLKLGLSPTDPRVRVEVTQRGARIVVRLGIAEEGAEPLAPVVDATLARYKRTCGTCFGIGCRACEGRGWMPRHNRTA